MKSINPLVLITVSALFSMAALAATPTGTPVEFTCPKLEMAQTQKDYSPNSFIKWKWSTFNSGVPQYLNKWEVQGSSDPYRKLRCHYYKKANTTSGNDEVGIYDLQVTSIQSMLPSVYKECVIIGGPKHFKCMNYPTPK
jgi:hypothetical protein